MLAGHLPDGRGLPPHHPDRGRRLRPGGHRRRAGPTASTPWAPSPARFSRASSCCRCSGLQRGHLRRRPARACCWPALLFLVAPALPRRQRLAGAALAVALALTGGLLPRWNLINFSVGFFRVSIAKDYIERRAQQRRWEKPELMFYEDGIATTVSVDRWGKTFSLKNNGKVDASSEADMPTQISVGLLPLLLYPHDVETRPPAGGAGRLRLGRDRRLDHPVPHRLAGGGRARAGHLPGLPLLRAGQPPAPGQSQGAGPGRRRPQLSHPAPRPLRRHREPALQPLDHRRVEPVHPGVLPGGQGPAGARRDLLPVGAALRAGTLEREVDLPHAAGGVPPRHGVFPGGSLLGHDPHRQQQPPAASIAGGWSSGWPTPARAPRPDAPGWASAHDVFAHLLLGPDEVESFAAGGAAQHRRQRPHRVQRPPGPARLLALRALPGPGATDRAGPTAG